MATSDGDAEGDARELSLPLHEDHGLFIAMSAPKFFDVQGEQVTRALSVSESASGLVIKAPTGERVRPVLPERELVIMLGSGAREWLHTSHALPGVMHGMQMPAVEGAEGRALRAWFGKMTLLPSYQRMLSSQLTFDEHVNATKEYLSTGSERALASVGCAPGRELVASVGTCKVLLDCSVKAAAEEPPNGCNYICNHEGNESDCQAQCTCASSDANGDRCWMLCNVNKCPGGDFTCTNQQLVCKSTPAPGKTRILVPLTNTTSFSVI